LVSKTSKKKAARSGLLNSFVWLGYIPIP
jgi:hypothetical protein